MDFSYLLITMYYFVFHKCQQAQGSASASQPCTQMPAATRTGTVQQASTIGTNVNKFKPPRKRAAPTQAGASVVPAQPGASTSAVTGTGAKRGRRKPASALPGYQYFTCSGNY